MRPVPEIDSPSGIDLHPEPPSPVRLSKRAGILALGIVFVVVALIGYGIYTRGQAQYRLGVPPDEPRGVTAATEAGKLVAAQVPNRPTLVVPAPNEAVEVTPAEPELRTNSQPNAYSPPAPPPIQAITPREPSLAERRLTAAYERELEARNAATTPRDGFSGATSPTASRALLSTGAADVEQMTSLLRAMQGPQGPTRATAALPTVSIGSAANNEDGFDTQNKQDSKEAFVARVRRAEKDHYLDATRVAPMSRYELKAGWDIPAILEQALNSDLPGEIRALVRENVYDTATGRYLLIPQGSRLTGTYDSRVSYGQDGLQVAWTRLIYPDASSIDLGGMSGQDAKGYTGLRHDVDNHYRRLLGFGMLTSLFSASFQLSQTRRGGLLGYPSAGEIAGSAVGRELSQLGADVTKRNLNIQPTIKVPVGYRFNVRVNRDIVFNGPFRPLRE
jgi:type IV secretory pathway VirB10-like protein